MKQPTLPLPDPTEAPYWRASAESSRRDYPQLPDRSRYYDAMADWHEGKRKDQPRAIGALGLAA